MFTLRLIIRYLSLCIKTTSLFLPTSCFLCHDHCNKKQLLCLDCERNLPFLSASCELCANILYTNSDRVCGACLNKPPAYNRLIALFQYKKPINSFIIRLKFQQQLRYARLLGELFAQELSKIYATIPLPQVIIPVPLHPKRLKERGFNQATLLAKPIGSLLKIPIIHDIAYRVKATETQSSLTKKARKKNMQHAFFVKEISDYQHVAIIDDVTTTRETLEALSLALKAAGVVTIDCWCIAKRMLDHEA